MNSSHLDPTIEAELFMLDFNSKAEERERFARSPEGAALLRLIADERKRSEDLQASVGRLQSALAHQDQRSRNHTVLLWGLVALLVLHIHGILPFG